MFVWRVKARYWRKTEEFRIQASSHVENKALKKFSCTISEIPGSFSEVTFFFFFLGPNEEIGITAKEQNKNG